MLTSAYFLHHHLIFISRAWKTCVFSCNFAADIYPCKLEERLRLKERIAIEIGESYYHEWKSAFEGPDGNKKPRDVKEVRYDMAKTLAAFSNADGGELFVGIEDDNTIIITLFHKKRNSTFK
ncbi:MAG: ATP-binding protein [Tannerella sp.]|jgi:hypothetical protein|nr:ATP-binding protein [Tannerella sp.]